MNIAENAIIHRIGRTVLKSFKYMRFVSIISVIVLFSSACSTFRQVEKEKDQNAANETINETVDDFNTIPLYEKPSDWENLESRENVIQKYSDYLKGLRIFIDPGHGGDDKRNKNLGGLVEADVNLSVALYLRDLLIRAGAVVGISREKDATVALYERAELAENFNADLFLSIHHNSGSSINDYKTNYTSTFYHAKEGELCYKASSRDLAKFIQRELAYVMRNPGGLGSFDGTYSDYIIYPGEGFAVLRETNMTGVLVECAFFTNRIENKRLRIPEFNEIQAWGIFKGIGRYLLNGVPSFELLADESILNKSILSLKLSIRDFLSVDPASIEIKLDGIILMHQYDVNSGTVSVEITSLEKGEYIITALCRNKNGNHSSPFSKKVVIN